MDLNRSINRQPILSYADSIGARCFFTSAKDGSGVQDLFMEMAKSIIQQRTVSTTFAQSLSNNPQPVTIEEAPPDKKKCCC